MTRREYATEYRHWIANRESRNKAVWLDYKTARQAHEANPNALSCFGKHMSNECKSVCSMWIRSACSCHFKTGPADGCVLMLEEEDA